MIITSINLKPYHHSASKNPVSFNTTLEPFLFSSHISSQPQASSKLVSVSKDLHLPDIFQYVFFCVTNFSHLANIFKVVVVVQSLSCVRLFATPLIAACQASLYFTISRSLLKLMSIESVMPSNHLILSRPLLLQPSIFSRNRVFSNQSALHMRWSKYWSFSFSISPSNEYPYNELLSGNKKECLINYFMQPTY